jgi:hypothetical protein
MALALSCYYSGAGIRKFALETISRKWAACAPFPFFGEGGQRILALLTLYSQQE